jgi:hypothetical protein
VDSTMDRHEPMVLLVRGRYGNRSPLYLGDLGVAGKACV